MASILRWPSLVATSRGDDRPAHRSRPAGDATRVYGEWRIRIKPDKGPDYNRLIEQSGLPLFREAGGRMVGWWNTLIGDLYEHVTIWEYDDMAAFERAIQFLSKNPAFARFVAARDPLLAGEESRFLRLAPGAARPSLPEPAPFVVHEIHRVPLARKDAYLAYMTRQGLGRTQGQWLPPGGPLGRRRGPMVRGHVPFPFESLAERERLDRQVLRDRGGPDLRQQGRRVRRGDHDSPADPGALLAQAARPRRPSAKPATSAVLPHREQIAPGVHVAGFADRYQLRQLRLGRAGRARPCSSTCPAECPCRSSWPWSPRPPASPPGRWC